MQNRRETRVTENKAEKKKEHRLTAAPRSINGSKSLSTVTSRVPAKSMRPPQSPRALACSSMFELPSVATTSAPWAASQRAQMPLPVVSSSARHGWALPFAAVRRLPRRRSRHGSCTTVQYLFPLLPTALSHSCALACQVSRASGARLASDMIPGCGC